MSPKLERPVLFVGPLPPPFHGQSVAFSIAYQGFSGAKILVNQNIGHRNKLYQAIISMTLVAKISKFLVVNRPGLLYLTCSRSLQGSLFDLMALNMFHMKGIPSAVHLHGADFKSFFHSLSPTYRRFVRAAYQRATTGIVLLDSMKEQFIDTVPKLPLQVVPNCYDPLLDREELAATKNGGEISILYFSNIAKTKGIFELLDAFERLAPSFPNIQLLIAGSFISDTEMKRRPLETAFTDRLNEVERRFPHRLHYLGVVHGSEKIALLTQSDLFVLPTYYPTEALPISILEAMRAGNAIVTTSHNYLPDLVSPSVGKLVPPRSVVALVGAMSYYIKETGELRRVQKENVKVAIRDFSPDRYRSQINSILRRRIKID